MGQLLYYQDIFHGGVTGDGYSSVNLVQKDTLQLHFAPGSSIRKAILFVNANKRSNGLDVNWEFGLNNVTLSPNINEAEMYFNYFFGQTQMIGKSMAIDVTELISTDNSLIIVEPPVGQSDLITNTRFDQFYLLVYYENPTMPLVSTSIYLNNQDCSMFMNYNFSNLNQINEMNDIGFTFVGMDFCNTTFDGSFVKVNNNPIGLVGGIESTTELGCTGVRGAFYYENNQLYGLDNDTPDSLMSGLDALCDIQPYMVNDAQFSVQFEYQNGIPNGSKSNPIFELFTAYSTPCDTFSVALPSDTVICQGAALPLHVSGGNRVEWSPAIGLSCYDCYDPVFIGDSSQHYFIRLWNTDSCSVVRPLHIGVDPLPYFGDVEVTPSNCGTSNGELNIAAAPSSQGPFLYAWNGTAIQTSNVFTNLPAGANYVSITDRFGCSHDTTVLIPEINPTTAAFTIDPSSGMVPLEVNISNLSTSSTHYSWLLNNQNLGNSLSSFVCDTSGTYTITVIAWQFDPSCADTTSLSIMVSPGIIIPTAFTPDNDQVNDVWDILFLDQNYPKNKVFVYDRWGKLLYESYPGFYYLHPWNGAFKDEALPVGSYYYIIQFNDEATEERKGVVSIVRE
jgi:gliding motility-associated-like protein